MFYIVSNSPIFLFLVFLYVFVVLSSGFFRNVYWCNEELLLPAEKLEKGALQSRNCGRFTNKSFHIASLIVVISAEVVVYCGEANSSAHFPILLRSCALEASILLDVVTHSFLYLERRKSDVIVLNQVRTFSKEINVTFLVSFIL